MREDDDFLERLRGPAAALRHQPDEVTLARIRARILERIEGPTVSGMLAGWLRPVAAAFAILTVVVTIGFITMPAPETPAFPESAIEVSIGEETYRVGD